MPLLFLLPFAGSITLFIISFAVGFMAVRVIQKIKAKNKNAEIYHQGSNPYAPVPVKDKAILTVKEKTAWEQLINNIK